MQGYRTPQISAPGVVFGMSDDMRECREPHVGRPLPASVVIVDGMSPQTMQDTHSWFLLIMVAAPPKVESLEASRGGL